ncbi:MAG: YchJ family protein [Candidatus Melainabacteria bacterium]
MSIAPDTPCPCQSGAPYGDCCEPFHTGQALPPTAARLMRSRYCAYALGLVDYLITTTHRENEQFTKNTMAWRLDLSQYCKNLDCRGLVIREEFPGETESVVVFEASLAFKGSPYKLFERSVFKKAGKRWLYHSGDSKTITE